MARKLITNEEIDNEIKNVEEAIANNPVDVSNLKETQAPVTLEAQIRVIDAQLADPATYPMVKDALVRVRTTVLRQRVALLQKEIRTLRSLMPPRTKRVNKV